MVLELQSCSRSLFSEMWANTFNMRYFYQRKSISFYRCNYFMRQNIETTRQNLVPRLLNIATY